MKVNFSMGDTVIIRIMLSDTTSMCQAPVHGVRSITRSDFYLIRYILTSLKDHDQPHLSSRNSHVIWLCENCLIARIGWLRVAKINLELAHEG